MAGELFQVGVRWSRYVMRRIARRVMHPRDFAAAAGKDRDFGEVLRFWRDILLGRRRLVLHYDRKSYGWSPCGLREQVLCCEHGCNKCERPLICYVERVELTEAVVWPPPGWQPPLTEAELDALLVEPAYDFGQCDVDPLNLAAA
jgi:hypothetical protein